MVTATEANYLPLGTIVFDNVLLDIRKNFDISAGIFVVPRTGKYLLIIDGMIKYNHQIYINIRVNDELVNQVIDFTESYEATFSRMLPINL